VTQRFRRNDEHPPSCARMRGAGHRRSGFVLLATLWVVVAMSAVALDLGLRSRTHRLAVANMLELSRARSAALAGTEHARSLLTVVLDGGSLSLAVAPATPPGMDPWAEPERLLPDTIRLERSAYVVRLRDTGTMVNLNVADEDQIRSLLRALRIDWGEADRMAQAIMDWRDADHFRRGRGAERDDYIRARADVLPRDGPFADVEELQWVRGVTAEVLDRVRPFVTTLGTGRININVASEPVLESLPGMTPAAVAIIQRHRRQRRPFRTAQELASELPVSARQILVARMTDFLRVAMFETREVEITSEGFVPGRPLRARVTGLFARANRSGLLVWRRIQ